MSTFVVKHEDKYVGYPTTHSCIPGLESVEWTREQRYAWRWCGPESGNGARITARKIGNGARVVRLRSRVQTSETKEPTT